MDRQKTINLKILENRMKELSSNIKLLVEEQKSKDIEEIKLTNHIAAKTYSKATLETTVTRLKNQKTLKQNELYLLNAEINQTQGQSVVFESVSNRTKDEVRKVNDSLCNEYSGQNRPEKILELNRSKLALESRMTGESDKIRQLHDKLDSQFALKNHLESALTNLRCEIYLETTKLTTTVADLNQYQGAYQNLVSEVAQRKQKIDQLQSELRQKQGEYDRLKVELNALLNEISPRDKTGAFSANNYFRRSL